MKHDFINPSLAASAPSVAHRCSHFVSGFFTSDAALLFSKGRYQYPAPLGEAEVEPVEDVLFVFYRDGQSQWMSVFDEKGCVRQVVVFSLNRVQSADANVKRDYQIAV